MQQDCSDFGGHKSTPRGGAIQPGSWRKAGTHWHNVGKLTGGGTRGVVVNAGARVTGGRGVTLHLVFGLDARVRASARPGLPGTVWAQTGGRTSGIVRMLGPRLRVDVPGMPGPRY